MAFLGWDLLMKQGNWWAHSALSWWTNQSYTARWALITHTFIRNRNLTVILRSDQLQCFKRIVQPKMKMLLSLISTQVVTQPILLGNTKGQILRNVLIVLFFCNETRLLSVRFDIKIIGSRGIMSSWIRKRSRIKRLLNCVEFALVAYFQSQKYIHIYNVQLDGSPWLVSL